MNFATFISDTMYNLIDSYAVKFTLQENDILIGGKNDLNVISYGVNDKGGHVLKYTRLLDTNDKWDYLMKKGEPVTMIAAWGRENYPCYHFDRTYGSALEIDSSNRVSLSPGQPYNKLTAAPAINLRVALEAHGILLLISWGVSFIGLIAARFFKHKYAWIWIHGFFMGFPTVTTIVLSIEAILALFGKTARLRPHHIIGFIMIGAVTIQFLSGLYTWYKLYRNKLNGVKTHKDIYLKWLHIVNSL